MLRRRLWLSLGIAAAGLFGCEDEPPPSRPAVLDAAPPPSFTSARQPSRTIYLEREEAGCTVYWQENGARSVKKSVVCPRDVEDGERLRLTGMTCHRESPMAERSVPVRCAQPLFLVRAREEGFDLAPAP